MMRFLRGEFRRFRRDQAGVSAVEFAFIAPLLILFYFGMAEITQAVIAQRRTLNTASAIADLVAQANGSITPTNLDNIMSISNVLMYPFPTSGTALKLCVYSIVADPTTGKKSIDWLRAKGDAKCVKSDTSINSLGTNIIAAGQSLIMARVTYTYTPSTSVVMNTVLPTFTRTYYLRPRRSTEIDCTTC